MAIWSTSKPGIKISASTPSPHNLMPVEAREVFYTVTVNGWPWKRPKACFVTDAHGGTWSHIETSFNWRTFRWVSEFERRDDSTIKTVREDK